MLRTNESMMGVVDTITFMTSTIFEYFRDFIYDKYGKDDKSLTYQHIFKNSKSNKFIKDLFTKLKEDDIKSTASIIFHRHRSFSVSDYQIKTNYESGSFVPSRGDINIYLSQSGMKEEEIKKTLSHELKHLYDYIYAGVSIIDKEANIDYFDRDSELSARIIGFINKYKSWDNDHLTIFNDITKDIPKLRENDRFKKKALKIIYAIKKAGLPSYVVVLPPTKKRERDINALTNMLDEHKIYYKYDEKHRGIEINNSILGIVDINLETGDLTYPALDILVDLVTNKNVTALIDMNSLKVVDILVNERKFKEKITLQWEKRMSWKEGSGEKGFYVFNKTPNYKYPNLEKGIPYKITYKSIVDAFYKNTYGYSLIDLKDRFLSLGLDMDYVLRGVGYILAEKRPLAIRSDLYNELFQLFNEEIVRSDLYYIEFDDSAYYLLNPANRFDLGAIERKAKEFKKVY